jgi:hypothetical protein
MPLNVMFLSTNIFIQIGIIAILVVIFIVVSILNHRTQAPKGKDLPEKCETCSSASCMIKLNEIKKIKEEIEKECAKHEEETNNGK